MIGLQDYALESWDLLPGKSRTIGKFRLLGFKIFFYKNIRQRLSTCDVIIKASSLHEHQVTDHLRF